MPTEHNLNNYTIRETDTGVHELEHDTNGLVWQYDPASDTIIPKKNVDADTNNITNVGSLGVESATIGGIGSNQHWELIHEVGGESSDDRYQSTTVDISAVDDGQPILIEAWSANVSGDTEINLRVIDGGTEASSGYSYTTMSSGTLTSNTGQSEFNLSTSVREAYIRAIYQRDLDSGSSSVSNQTMNEHSDSALVEGSIGNAADELRIFSDESIGLQKVKVYKGVPRTA